MVVECFTVKDKLHMLSYRILGLVFRVVTAEKCYVDTDTHDNVSCSFCPGNIAQRI